MYTFDYAKELHLRKYTIARQPNGARNMSGILSSNIVKRIGDVTMMLQKHLLSVCNRFEINFRFIFFAISTLLLTFLPIHCSFADVLMLPDGLVRIDNEAFMNDGNITQVLIPESVKAIGDRAFYGCSNLQIVQIHNYEGEVEIGVDAFPNTNIIYTKYQNDDVINDYNRCGPRAYYVIDGNNMIIKGQGRIYKYVDIENPSSSDDPFINISMSARNITKIIIEEGITQIGWCCFDDFDFVESISIPSTLTHLDVGDIFFGNRSLKNIEVADNSDYYTAIDGIAFSKDIKELVWYPYDKLGNSTFP